MQAAANRLPPVLRGMLWMAGAGLTFTFLNTSMRVLTTQLDPFQTQFMRYFCGLLVMLPFVARSGLAAYAPKGLTGQIWRGLVHTAGLVVWFIALPHVSMADMTAIGFTSPIFVMIGAVVFLGEKITRARWVAAAIGFLGVIVIVGPAGGGNLHYDLMMLLSSPLFAASFLITKALSRRDKAEVIVVWQSITVTLFSLPLAVLHWTWPSAWQWGAFLICGALGSAGHYCMTRAFRTADISATQPIKFLDLLWTSIAGFLVFGDVPGPWTIAGAAVIFASTSWLARRESRERA
jgi:drug/metabolite transporter (DMT)-like permease